MKLNAPIGSAENRLSPPARGAWIETLQFRRALPPRGKSPPARGAWIETPSGPSVIRSVPVAPRAGGVD